MLALSREEFESRALAVGDLWLAAVLRGVAVVILAMTLPWALPLAGAPRSWFVVATTALLVVAFAAVLPAVRRADALLKELGLECPSCGEELVGGGRSEGSRHHKVLATGQCPQCGVQLLPPPAPGMAEPRRDPRAYFYFLAILGCLVIGVFGNMWLSGLSYRRADEQRCARWLAAAHSPVQRARVERLRPSRRSKLTCGEVLARAAQPRR